MILVLEHIDIEGPGSIEEFLRNAARPLSIVNLAQKERLPSSLQNLDAVISLGGPMNVYEENKYSFLKEEDVFLKEALRLKIPILGICLGAQLLSKACGAEVKKAKTREIGWYKISLTEAGSIDPLFKNVKDGLEVFEWHEDTFELPQGGVLLATNQACRNQAFRIGNNAYGLQFHIEVTPQIIDSWIAAYTNEENRGFDAKEMLEHAYKVRGVFENRANAVYSNFVDIIDCVTA